MPWLNKVTQVGGFGLWLGGEEAEEEKSKEIKKKKEKLTLPWEVLDWKGWPQQKPPPPPSLPSATSPIINTPRGESLKQMLPLAHQERSLVC